MAEIINKILNTNKERVAIQIQSINFKEDFEGKGLLNKEISKLYNGASTEEFEGIVIKCHVIIEKMAKLPSCNWSIPDLKNQLAQALSKYETRNIGQVYSRTHIESAQLLNATAIGKHFIISSQRLNLILSELGWIEKGISGWSVTKLGKTVGGKQFEHETSGGTYVLWPKNILQNDSLRNGINHTAAQNVITKNTISSIQETPGPVSTGYNFRDKFEARHRTKDGHYVRSRAEVIIDDTLYDYGLVHAYEKKVPIEEELYTDFYLPNGKVYIEFWGMESDPKYLERKQKKIEMYRKYELKLIELTDNDILNLDDHLPKKLLKYGIKVY